MKRRQFVMRRLKRPDLCGDVEQIADEILDMGNERQKQVRLRFPVIGTAIAAGID
jgi:hypothetical protein